MKIILHGILKHRYNGPSEIHGETVAEVLEGWSVQTEMRHEAFNERIAITVAGFETVEKLGQPTTVQEIHILPAMIGGGGFFRIILGAAMIAVGTLLQAVPGIGQTIGTALITAGIGMVIGGVMALFMKAPSISKDKDPDSSKYLGGGDNTAGIGQVIGRGYGRCMVGGHYLSIQVNAQDMAYGTFPTNPS